MSRNIKIVFVVLFLFLLFLGPFQQFTSVFKVIPLGGYVPDVEILATKEDFLSGKCQRSVDLFVKANYGFGPHYVRLTNETTYRLFDEIETPVVRIEKGDLLLEQDYINCLGEGCSPKKEQFDQLQKELAYVQEKSPIPIMVLMAPSKARFFKDSIQIEQSIGYNGYQKYAELFNRLQIPYINYYSWFESLRASEGDYLFTKNGIHWSLYGATLAADTMVGKLSQVLSRPVPGFEIGEIEYSSRPRKTDDDLVKLLNIISPIDNGTMAYPTLTFNDGKKVKAAIIGDSFFISFYHIGFFQNTFGNQSHFLFYNRVFYDHSNQTEILVKDISMERVLKDKEVLIFSYTEPQMRNFSNGFIHEYYEYLKGRE